MKAIAQTRSTPFISMDSSTGYEMHKNPVTLSVSIYSGSGTCKMHKIIQECKSWE